MTAGRAKRILVVEDEYFLADDLKKALDSEGLVVVGPVGSEADALAVLDSEQLDGAVLDINLHGRMVYPLARHLRERNVPFLFVTGYDEPEANAGFDDVQLVRKPFQTEALMRGIGRLISEADPTAR